MSKSDIKYRDAIAEIESILASIDKGDMDIDELAEKVKRVTVLLEFCKKKLRSTESEIEKIMAELDKQEGK
jgi:exodeoxyribonuclease VII small subunit